MAQLTFIYGTMSSGKSFELLKTHYNYTQQNKKCLAFKPAVDNRAGDNVIGSRVNGLSIEAPNIDENVFEVIEKESKEGQVYCVLVDEAQFLSKNIILELSKVVDVLGIPVICFGLKTDFMGELFEGSKALLELSDKIKEVKTICVLCNKKATMNLRTLDGKAIYTGEQIQIGDLEYLPTCRDCYNNYNEYKK